MSTRAAPIENVLIVLEGAHPRLTSSRSKPRMRESTWRTFAPKANKDSQGQLTAIGTYAPRSLFASAQTTTDLHRQPTETDAHAIPPTAIVLTIALFSIAQPATRAADPGAQVDRWQEIFDHSCR